MDLPEINEMLIPCVGKTAKLQRLFIADKLKQSQIDLTIEQWFLLGRLYRQDGPKQNDLAFITDRDKASLARLVTTLEKKNLVVRIPSKEDKRINMIYLTNQGRVVFKQTIPIVNEAFEVLQQDISQQERESVIAILNKIQHNINGHLK